VSWVLKGGVELAGVTVSAQTMQKMCIAVSDFMESEGIFFDYQARVDREAAALGEALEQE
jgi:hypothetical protein